MEKTIKVNSKYGSLEQLVDFIKAESSYDVTQAYDSWDVRTDEKGEMEMCIVVKKSSMHGMKMYFSDKDTLKVDYIIPNKLMNAYFGKSQQKYQGIGEIITEKIKALVFTKSQNKAFEEMMQVLDKAKA